MPGGVDIIVIVIQLWTVSAHGWGGVREGSDMILNLQGRSTPYTIFKG